VPSDAHPFNDIIIEEQLFPVGSSLEELRSTSVHARSVHHRHKYPVVGVRGVLEFFVAPASENEKAR
jgi:hypothetical protein